MYIIFKSARKMKNLQIVPNLEIRYFYFIVRIKKFSIIYQCESMLFEAMSK